MSGGDTGGRGWTAQLESANMHHSKQAAKWKEIAQIDRRHQRKSIGVAAWKCTRSGSRGGGGADSRLKIADGDLERYRHNHVPADEAADQQNFYIFFF